MDYIITHYPDKKRFETQVDGVVAFLYSIVYLGINWILSTRLFRPLSEGEGLLPL